MTSVWYAIRVTWGTFGQRNNIGETEAMEILNDEKTWFDSVEEWVSGFNSSSDKTLHLSVSVIKHGTYLGSIIIWRGEFTQSPNFDPMKPMAACLFCFLI